MTRTEFEELSLVSQTPLPIMLRDGRMGLVPYWTDTHAIVDAYRGNDCEQIFISWGDVEHVGNGALLQVAQPTS